MNTTFFNKTQTVNVSRISEDGWWIENTSEHVVKGTALGTDFTINTYTPSNSSMIAQYHRETDTWSDEIKNRTWDEYFNEHGQRFVIGTPDGEYPDWAITTKPPMYDEDTQTVLYKNQQWHIYDILIGQPFYDEFGHEFLVSDYNFELPDNCTFIPPPELRSNQYAVRLVDGEWQQLLDYRGQMAFTKNRDTGEDYQIEELGDVPNTHTLTEPEPFDSWVNNAWQYDMERHRPVKEVEEKQWRNEQLTKVLDRIDQYEKDQSYPLELRTSPIQTESDYLRLLQDRKSLSDYPESNEFPFGERPDISGLAN